ncbi:MAG: hypothetical protein IJ405_05295 [Lachnospiraceae bacterium]|nr:hypothetical protein [Lachnospiraceae bacterium]MBQ7781424.1 hypothetical protein [Lachnospiraceae bacterium]
MKAIKKKLLAGISVCLIGLCLCACIPKITTPNEDSNVQSSTIITRNDDEPLFTIIAV